MSDSSKKETLSEKAEVVFKPLYRSQAIEDYLAARATRDIPRTNAAFVEGIDRFLKNNP